MKEGLYFLLVILVLMFIVWYVQKQQREGFQTQENPGPKAPDGFQAQENPGPKPPEMNIPIVSPRYQTLVEGEAKPFAPPSTSLLAPPPGQAASINSRPAEDPALKKSSEGRIQSVLESVKGFLEREAPGLSQLGDPTVQLPLSTARSDATRLQSEMDVLKRNPGLPSSLTEEDVNGIEANLGYLQNKWRMSANAMSESPMPPTEGFASGAGSRKGLFSWLFDWGNYEGFQAGSTGSTQPSPNAPTMQELYDLKTKISIQIVSLESSQSTDLNTQARINKLREIHELVGDIIKEIEEGKRTLADVPITKDSIKAFLPVMENQNTAIPNLIDEKGLPNVLNSLFPKYFTGDSTNTDQSQKLFETYAQSLLSNLSWDVGLHYKGKAEQDIARAQADAMRDAKMAAEWSPTGKGDAGKSTPAPVSSDHAANYRGFLQDVVTSMTGGNGVSSKVSVNGDDGSAAAEAAKAKAAPGLDWKKRSAAICDQIRGRGYNPSDFGCLENPDKVSADFSWRGYSRMICNRLSTVYDPGIPELCGCPPPTWPGWRA